MPGLNVHLASDEQARAVLGGQMPGAEMSRKKKRALETASLPQSEGDQPAVVSSADGAKILNNLDNAISAYENREVKRADTFIGDVAKALGAKNHGSKSQYATFETKNGKIVTIRLADHNATVSTFDNHNEAEGISIVITAKKNQRMTDDGRAHVVEFYYDAIKLRRAEDKPLAEIIKSIKQALYSGEFKDNTGLAERQEVNVPRVELQLVWHGSGSLFDAFEHSHMGEGEGNQAYGYGTYVAQSKDTAITYAGVAGDKTGEKVLYSVEIPDNNGHNFLSFDKPLSVEEGERIKNALIEHLISDEESGYDYPGAESDLRRELGGFTMWTGRTAYGDVSAYLGSGKAASKLFHQLG